MPNNRNVEADGYPIPKAEDGHSDRGRASGVDLQQRTVLDLQRIEGSASRSMSFGVAMCSLAWLSLAMGRPNIGIIAMLLQCLALARWMHLRRLRSIFQRRILHERIQSRRHP